MSAIIHLCIPRMYKFNGVEFEVTLTGMPWPTKKDGDPKKRAGRVFFARIKPWLDMALEYKEAYRVGGGCRVTHG